MGHLRGNNRPLSKLRKLLDRDAEEGAVKEGSCPMPKPRIEVDPVIRMGSSDRVVGLSRKFLAIQPYMPILFYLGLVESDRLAAAAQGNRRQEGRQRR